VSATLPAFSRGLKLVRIGVFMMLIQIALAIVMEIKAVSASTPDEAKSAIEFMQYFLAANIAATAAMLVGTLRAIPELARAGMDITALIVAAAGFAIATAALVWSYMVIGSLLDALNRGALDELLAATKNLASLKPVTSVKDVSYAVALISVVKTVEKSAAYNDQLALRDYAGSMVRALIVMLGGDLFYQLTYGLGGSIGVLGFVGSLLVLGFWIYCHVRLQRFLFNAAYFMNEPHNLPGARVIEKPKPSTRTAPANEPRPSAPVVAPLASPAPVIVVPQRPVAPTPRAASTGDAASDGPKFLR
jgi:hypothetical protein